MTGIVAVDQNFLIGFNSIKYINDSLFRIPWGKELQDDLKFFNTKTRGSYIIMGSKTAQSIGYLLPNRNSIILSSKDSLKIGTKILYYYYDNNININAILLKEWEQIFNLLSEVNKNIFLIGGSSLFKQALEQNLIDDFYFTYINANFIGQIKEHEEAIYLPKVLCNKLKVIMESKKPIKYFNKGSRNAYKAQIYYSRINL